MPASDLNIVVMMSFSCFHDLASLNTRADETFKHREVVVAVVARMKPTTTLRTTEHHEPVE